MGAPPISGGASRQLKWVDSRWGVVFWTRIFTSLLGGVFHQFLPNCYRFADFAEAVEGGGMRDAGYGVTMRMP